VWRIGKCAFGCDWKTDLVAEIEGGEGYCGGCYKRERPGFMQKMEIPLGRTILQAYEITAIEGVPR
jgi:hypothetical protein